MARLVHRELPRFGVASRRIAPLRPEPARGRGRAVRPRGAARCSRRRSRRCGGGPRRSQARSRPTPCSCGPREGEFDAVVAGYHDQGLIPVKLAAFGHAVNVTLGPAVRAHVRGPRDRIRHRREGHRRAGEPTRSDEAGRGSRAELSAAPRSPRPALAALAQRLVRLPLDVLALDRLALVVRPLAARQPDLELDPPVLEVGAQRHDREALARWPCRPASGSRACAGAACASAPRCGSGGCRGCRDRCGSPRGTARRRGTRRRRR